MDEINLPLNYIDPELSRKPLKSICPLFQEFHIENVKQSENLQACKE